MTPDEVRAHRKTLGLTQARLAEAMRKSLRAIKYWEDDDAPERQRITASDAILLLYMVKFGLPEAALRGRLK